MQGAPLFSFPTCRSQMEQQWCSFLSCTMAVLSPRDWARRAAPLERVSRSRHAHLLGLPAVLEWSRVRVTRVPGWASRNPGHAMCLTWVSHTFLPMG